MQKHVKYKTLNYKVKNSMKTKEMITVGKAKPTSQPTNQKQIKFKPKRDYRNKDHIRNNIRYNSKNNLCIIKIKCNKKGNLTYNWKKNKSYQKQNM